MRRTTLLMRASTPVPPGVAILELVVLLRSLAYLLSVVSILFRL